MPALASLALLLQSAEARESRAESRSGSMKSSAHWGEPLSGDLFQSEGDLRCFDQLQGKVDEIQRQIQELQGKTQDKALRLRQLVLKGER